MALNIYRRHASHCIAGHALHEMSYESDELHATRGARSRADVGTVGMVSGNAYRPVGGNAATGAANNTRTIAED